MSIPPPREEEGGGKGGGVGGVGGVWCGGGVSIISLPNPLNCPQTAL